MKLKFMWYEAKQIDRCVDHWDAHNIISENESHQYVCCNFSWLKDVKSHERYEWLWQDSFLMRLVHAVSRVTT